MKKLFSGFIIFIWTPVMVLLCLYLLSESFRTGNENITLPNTGPANYDIEMTVEPDRKEKIVGLGSMLKPLSALLTKYPDRTSFKLKQAVGPPDLPTWCEYEVTYDRNSHLLRELSLIHTWQSDTYSNVTDDVIHQAASTGGKWPQFHRSLIQNGCRYQVDKV